MKTRLFFLPVLALTTIMSVSAQQIESDDVYFTSKDRAKEKASRLVSFSANNNIRATDQYSGRDINPEYNSRLNVNSDAIQGSTTPYFNSNYKPAVPGNLRYPSNPYYGNSFYNSPYSSWNNSFSSGLYGAPGMYGFNPYNSGLYSPYSVFSPYDYMSMGASYYSPSYYSPMMFGYGYSPFAYSSMMYYYMYAPYYGYGSGMGSGYGGDITTTTASGKRTSRSSMTNNSVVPSSPATVYSPAAPAQNDYPYTLPASGGRTGTAQYYQPDWRNNPDVISNSNDSRRQNGSSYSRSQSLGTQNPSWSGSTSRSTWNNTNSSNSSGRSFESQTRIQSVSPSYSSPPSFSSPSPSFSSPSSSPSWGGGGSSSSGGGGGQSSRGR
jgi:hypothetical protein